MDNETLQAYSKNAKSYSQRWLSQPVPTDMYSLLTKHFVPGGKTADIGCGNGRDANWLLEQGFPTIGYDSSPELLEIARALYPGGRFQVATLPELSEIQEGFDNVLCETVIMHLPTRQIPLAISNLTRILNPGGVLYLSWRTADAKDTRTPDGRLYSSFAPGLILAALAPLQIEHYQAEESASSKNQVFRVIAKQLK